MVHFQPMFARCVKKGQAGSLQVLIEEIGWEVRDFGLLIPFVKKKVHALTEW